MAFLGGAFKAASVGVIAAGLSIAPADASIDSRDKLEQQKPGAMDVVMDRLLSGLNYEMRAPSAPTNTIVADARQQTSNAPNAKGSFNAAVVASPELGQKIADVTAALDSKPVEKLRADVAPVANADVGKIDRDTAARGQVADKAMAAVNKMKDVAQNSGKPSVSGLAANSFASAAAGAVATSMGAPPRIVAAAQVVFDAVAANGAGTFGAPTPSTLSASFNNRDKGARTQMAPGYTTSVSAPQPAQQTQAPKPVEIAGREDLYGRATLAGDGLNGIASLKIDGKGLDVLQRNIGAMTRDARETRQTMDLIAMNGFRIDIGDAAARIGGGGLSDRQVDPLVAANAPVTIRPLAARPGMGGGFA